MADKRFNNPDLFINRELSWLEFNDRVLREGLADDVPLMERLKFLAIVGSNLDEFFMVRVAGLRQQRAAGVRKRDVSGLAPGQQLDAIGRRVHRMLEEQAKGIAQALAELRSHGLAVLGPAEWTPEQQRFLERHFAEQVLPVLTPLAVQDLDPRPLLPGLELNAAFLVSPGESDRGEARIVVVPIPRRFPRFVTLPAQEGTSLARLEDVVVAHASALFAGGHIAAVGTFRITRDADVPIQDDDAGDLLHAVQEAVLARRRRAAVRLTISAGADRRIRDSLVALLDLRDDDVYEIDGMLDTAALWEIANRPGFAPLRYPDWSPQTPRNLLGVDDLWRAVRDHDVLLVHPYESFEPVVRLLELAAQDPDVLAVKQTLYRTSGDSPIIRALGQAAQNGKQVTVLVELQARFDEARNVGWARRLEDAGCHVVYGVLGYKTHAKALLLVRREPDRLRRYVHLATGNYNDRTARLYSDIGLMTCNEDVAADVAALFNLLTGYSEAVGWSRLTIAPTDLRRRFEELIDREIQAGTPDRPGLILAKVNSLQDAAICRALYRASRAGVTIRLNVRGLCCLRPGLKGVSETIEVRSIVDRFLEHARIFYFRNGGHEEVYLSSADWMPRNLDKRIETLFPVLEASTRRRLIAILETYFADNTKAWRLQSDGSYERVRGRGTPVRSQERLYREAVEAVQMFGQAPARFRPLARPEP